ncbi:MAG: GtrA family protein [Bacteroidales bacterium]|nr:GtrA family protein [Bacteroidales bacterium]
MTLKELIKLLFTERSSDIKVQAFRYLVSGGTAFLVDAGLLALLTELFGRERLLVWTGIAFVAGLTITYLFSIFWVFDNRSMKSRTAEILIFILIGLCGLGLTELFMWVFADKAHIHYMISKVITTVIVFFWNFFAKKLILFRNK